MVTYDEKTMLFTSGGLERKVICIATDWFTIPPIMLCMRVYTTCCLEVNNLRYCDLTDLGALQTVPLD